MRDLDAATAATLAASRALLGVVAASLAPVSGQVTLPQFRALVLLASLGSSRIGDLADRLGVHPSTFSRTADRLVTAGLVRRSENPQSRREILVDLTPKGRRLVTSVTRRRTQALRAILATMSIQQRETLIEAFSLFAAAADEPGPVDPDGVLGL